MLVKRYLDRTAGWPPRIAISRFFGSSKQLGKDGPEPASCHQAVRVGRVGSVFIRQCVMPLDRSVVRVEATSSQKKLRSRPKANYLNKRSAGPTARKLKSGAARPLPAREKSRRQTPRKKTERNQRQNPD